MSPAVSDRPPDSDGVPVTLVLPWALRPLTGGRETIELRAASVAGLLALLRASRPDLHVRVCDEQGMPRPHLNLFVNLDHVREREGLATRFNAGDELYILPAVSGG